MIDAKPVLDSSTAQVIGVSDLVITPTKIGALENWAFSDFRIAIEQHRKMFVKPIHAAFVTEAPTLPSLYETDIKPTLEAINDCGVILLPIMWWRVWISRATNEGKITIQMNNDNATRDIEQLTSKVLEVLG